MRFLAPVLILAACSVPEPTVTTTYLNFAGEPFSAVAVDFDGANDYLTRGAGLTGAADSKKITVSFWMKHDDDVGDHIIFNGQSTVGGSTTRGFQINSLESLNNVAFGGWNASATLVLAKQSDEDSVQASLGWVHVLASFDLSDVSKQFIYINDVAATPAATTFTNNNMDFTIAEWSIGGKANGDNKFTGDLAEFWLDFGTYIDLSDEENRRKFIDSAGKPVDLGADGSTPTGVSPTIYLSNPLATWQENNGTGGDFTENGALTAAASSPSD